MNHPDWMVLDMTMLMAVLDYSRRPSVHSFDL